MNRLHRGVASSRKYNMRLNVNKRPLKGTRYDDVHELHEVSLV